MTTQDSLFGPDPNTILATATRQHRTPADPTSLWTQLTSAGQKPRGRGARHQACRTCGTKILAGHDADGIYTHTDTRPLTPIGEMLVLLAGGHTHELRIAHAGALQIGSTRKAWKIRNQPAAAPRDPFLAFDVVARHQCHSTPIPPEGITTTQLIQPRPPAPTDQPPF